jgi:LysM repeat protein
MGGVGASAPMTNPALSLAPQPQVAGATGGGQTTSALPTGQGDLGAVLLQLTKVVEALTQALAGMGAIGGGPGQLPPTKTDEPPVTPPPVEPPTKTDEPPAKTPQTYTVKQGDTLSKIAKAHGITPWQSLYELNKDVIGPSPDVGYSGMQLRLPS